jgi:hypothetical protein
MPGTGHYEPSRGVGCLVFLWVDSIQCGLCLSFPLQGGAVVSDNDRAGCGLCSPSWAGMITAYVLSRLASSPPPQPLLQENQGNAAGGQGRRVGAQLNVSREKLILQWNRQLMLLGPLHPSTPHPTPPATATASSSSFLTFWQGEPSSWKNPVLFPSAHP